MNLPNRTCNIRKISLPKQMLKVMKVTVFLVTILFVNVFADTKAHETTIEKNTTQSRIARGHVTDSLGKPLRGVSVTVKNTSNRTTTNQEGFFEIILPDASQAIVFTYIGMQRMEVTEISQNMRVTMQTARETLEDVVVTGYADIRKESFTGNAITVSKEQLLRTNPNNLIEGLQSFDPSFRIKENPVWGSNPNNLPEFTIRGESSIGMDKSLTAEQDRLSGTQRTNLKDNPNLPIFILDGFEVSVQTIYDMDINRIESVNILKDAAATALYGSRAANGVLVVTSVPPVPGEMRISYSLSGGVELPDLSDYNLTNAEEKLEAELLSGVYDLDDVPAEIRYNEIANRIRRGVNTDWLAQPLRNAFNQNHSLVLDGGVESIRYALNFTHNTNNGAMKGSYRNRTGAGLTVDYRGRKFQLKNQVTYNATNMQESPYGTFSTYTTQQPYEEIFDENGEYLPNLSGLAAPINPLWLTTLDSYAGRGHVNELQNNLSANWEIFDGFQFRGQFSVTKSDFKENTYRDPKEWHYTTANDQRGSLREDIGTGYSWNTNALFHYNKLIDKHFINATAGFNARETYENDYTMNYVGFQLGSLQGPPFAARQSSKTAYNSAKTRLFGTLASVNYTYDNIYLLDASVRLDGSSQFGSDKKTAPFWATGLGLNIHRYPFLADSRSISLLRLRATYGSTGKVNFPAYTAITSYDINAESWYFTGPAASIVYLGNPQLKWETTKTFDAGFELGLFNDRYYLRASYYNKETDDLIDQVSIATASGFSTYRANSGTILNQGVELDLHATVYRDRDWVLTLYGNLGANKNKITELGTASQAYNDAVNAQYEAAFGNRVLQTNPLTRYYVGASTTAIFAMRSAGIDPANGREKFIRSDGTSTYTWSAIDQVVVGDRSPTAQGAFGLNVGFRGFYLNSSFLYQWGAQTYNSTLLDKVENANIANQNVDRRVLSDRWKTPGDVVSFLDISTTRVTKPTSRFVQNYDYLNLSALSVGYDFKREQIRAWGLSNLGIRINANDVFRLSTVKEERGTSYPYARNYTFTVTVGL